MEFENISNKLKIKLLAITSKDKYGLKPMTLYRNILHSTGNHETLAKVFNVPVEIVEEVKKPSR